MHSGNLIDVVHDVEAVHNHPLLQVVHQGGNHQRIEPETIPRIRTTYDCPLSSQTQHQRLRWIQSKCELLQPGQDRDLLLLEVRHKLGGNSSAGSGQLRGRQN